MDPDHHRRTPRQTFCCQDRSPGAPAPALRSCNHLPAPFHRSLSQATYLRASGADASLITSLSDHGTNYITFFPLGRGRDFTLMGALLHTLLFSKPRKRRTGDQGTSRQIRVRAGAAILCINMRFSQVSDPTCPSAGRGGPACCRTGAGFSPSLCKKALYYDERSYKISLLRALIMIL